MVLCFAVLVLAPRAVYAAAGATPGWAEESNVYYEANDSRKASVTWGITFEACYASAAEAGIKRFAYTNMTRWHGRPGCSVVSPNISVTRCTAGPCGNWDTYECVAAAVSGCAAPLPPASKTALSFANALSSNMVLQRGVPARIWGSVSPTVDGAVTVTVAGGAGSETLTATVDQHTGQWTADLKPRNATTDGSSIVVSQGGVSAEITGVLWGDVWGCHGQSNMAFGLGQDIDAETECMSTADFPLIRLMTYTSAGKAWEIASPSTACTGKGFSAFSAVCWYFGKDQFLANDAKVPVGLVSSNVGGTAVERWSGPDAIAKCNQTGVVKQSNLWFPYIVPLLPMQFSGWIWYQGESNVACSVGWKWLPGLNCGIGCSAANPVCNASITGCADFYSCQFPAMIEDWRAKFNGGGAPIPGRGGAARPFVFVELAPYTEGVGWHGDISTALIREAQLAALALPAVAMAAAYDYGDVASPLGNIHPRYKSPVGRRLSRGASTIMSLAPASSEASMSGAGKLMNPVAISAVAGPGQYPI